MTRTSAVLALLVAVPAIAFAQKPVTETASAELTATIEAIDQSSRLVTLKDKTGATETIYAGPEVKRFAELKVGDTVTFRYMESVAYQIRKPGQPSGPAAKGETTLARGKGPKPSGTLSKQESATVTVKAIDAKVPSITVATDDGRVSSYRVNDKKNLEGVAVGDRVEITYTVALMISVN
jgi:Cu/Ag efflux protein CusF